MSAKNQKSRKRPTRASAADFQNVPYLEVRSRFLSAYDKDNYIEWLVQVGRYVQHCWLAEEAARKGDEFNELDSWDRWDQCDEAKIRSLRAEALEALKEHKQNFQWSLFATEVRNRLKPIKPLAWHLAELYRGFLGGLGILLFGLLVAWAAPGVVRMVRSAVDEILPTQTQPRLREEPVTVERKSSPH